MANTTSIRSFLKDTQAGLDLLLSLTDEQLESREKLADLTKTLSVERAAANDLLDGLREVHLKHQRGYGVKAKRAHLEEIIETYEGQRFNNVYSLNPDEPPNLRALIRQGVDDCEEEAQATEIPSISDLIAEAHANREGRGTGRTVVAEEPDLLERVVSQHDSVRNLDLRKNATTALEKANIHNIGQLLQQTPLYLLSLPQFGPTSLDDAQESLDRLGFEWRFANNEDLEKSREERAKADRQRKARAYYRKNRKRILKKQRAYKQAKVDRLRELEAKEERGHGKDPLLSAAQSVWANERGDQ